MRVARKLRAHIDRRPAALSIKASHRHVVGVLKDIFAEREIPTAAYAGDIYVIVPGPVNARKIGCLHLVAGVRIENRCGQLPLQYYSIVAGLPKLERLCRTSGGNADKRHLRPINRVANLIHLDGGCRFWSGPNCLAF